MTRFAHADRKVLAITAENKGRTVCTTGYSL